MGECDVENQQEVDSVSHITLPGVPTRKTVDYKDYRKQKDVPSIRKPLWKSLLESLKKESVKIKK